LGWRTSSVLGHLEQACEGVRGISAGDVVPGGQELLNLETPLRVQVRQDRGEHGEAEVDALMDEQWAVDLLERGPLG